MLGGPGKSREGAMGSQDSAVVVRRWPAIGVLVLTLSWCSIPTARGEAADGEGGDGSAAEGGVRGCRLLLSVQEAKGNASFRCSPSGLCLPCQYSEKNDDKYRCSETGYRVPLKCVRIKDGIEEASRIRTLRSLLYLQEHASGVQKRLLIPISNYKWRKLLAESSKLENEEENYITYRSCVPVDSNEKLSVLGFEVIMLGLLLISGSVVYLRQKRTAFMSGVAQMRVSTSSPRF
ncbi:unnamed protein product [Musa hybrid cultivar]